MIGVSEIRAIAMALSQVTEAPLVPAARRIASYKVAGKGFVGLEKGGMTMTAGLPQKEAKILIAENPDAYEEIWHDRKKFMGLRVDLSKVSTEAVRGIIEMSWRHTAPKHIVVAYDKRA